jgi:argininosuccinate lyase
MTKMLPQVWFNKDRMRQATTTGFLNATDMADYLVGRGIPFREAHAVVGRAVAYALDQGRELDQLTLAEMRTFSEVIDEALFEALAVEQVVNRRTSKGGTAEANVRAAVQRAADQLATEQQPPE